MKEESLDKEFSKSLFFNYPLKRYVLEKGGKKKKDREKGRKQAAFNLAR